MGFKETLKEKRTAANLTQAQLAQKASVAVRTIQNYEMGARRPANLEVVNKIATALETSTEELLGQSGMYIMEAAQKGGSKAAKDIDELVSEVTGMFAGGKISDEAMDGAMQALNRAYWMAKEKNKKYAPKKAAKTDAE